MTLHFSLTDLQMRIVIVAMVLLGLLLWNIIHRWVRRKMGFNGDDMVAFYGVTAVGLCFISFVSAIFGRYIYYGNFDTLPPGTVFEPGKTILCGLPCSLAATLVILKMLGAFSVDSE